MKVLIKLRFFYAQLEICGSNTRILFCVIRTPYCLLSIFEAVLWDYTCCCLHSCAWFENANVFLYALISVIIAWCFLIKAAAESSSKSSLRCSALSFVIEQFSFLNLVLSNVHVASCPRLYIQKFINFSVFQKKSFY
jgi:hypothetical protein